MRVALWIVIAITFGLAGCTSPPGEAIAEELKSKYWMEQELVQSIDTFTKIDRFENKESICYVFVSYKKGGISCKWK